MFPLKAEGVAVYPYRKQGDAYEFLQLHRSETDDAFPSTWQGIYGSAEKNESAVDAAKRELLEETGLTPLKMFMVEYIEMFLFRPTNSIIHLPVFAAEIDATCQPILNEEHDDFRWIHESEVRQKFMWRSQRESIGVLLETLKEFPQHIPQLLV